MRQRSLPGGGQEYATERGTLALWALPPLVVIRMSGVGEGDFAAHVIDAFDIARRAGRPVQLFFDMEGMLSYDSALRTRLTDHFVKLRGDIGSLHVITVSKLVAMGVSVANLALGGMITNHSRRQPFMAAIDAAIVQAKLPGIRSSAFAP